jgi:hypothetical protein
MKIEEVFQSLQEMNVCRSAYDFSKNYLKRDRSYYSVIKVKHAQPSVDTWVMLERSLRQRGRQFAQSSNIYLSTVGEAIDELASKVRQEIDRQLNERK